MQGFLRPIGRYPQHLRKQRNTQAYTMQGFLRPIGRNPQHLRKQRNTQAYTMQGWQSMV
jgi:hypothetical protein